MRGAQREELRDYQQQRSGRPHFSDFTKSAAGKNEGNKAAQGHDIVVVPDAGLRCPGMFRGAIPANR
jgi:hypothetical protein